MNTIHKMTPEKIIRKYGYEYHLVPADKRENDLPQPKFMGYDGYALKSVKKIKK